jgi:hypothetical protein
MMLPFRSWTLEALHRERGPVREVLFFVRPRLHGLAVTRRSWPGRSPHHAGGRRGKERGAQRSSDWRRGVRSTPPTKAQPLHSPDQTSAVVGRSLRVHSPITCSSHAARQQRRHRLPRIGKYATEAPQTSAAPADTRSVIRHKASLRNGARSCNLRGSSFCRGPVCFSSQSAVEEPPAAWIRGHSAARPVRLTLVQQ